MSMMVACLAIASLLVLGALLNWGILTMFGQTSTDRTVHGQVGICLLMAYVIVRARAWRWLPAHGDRSSVVRVSRLFLIALVPCYLGTVFPDLDLRWGIGNHRNPLFHSSLSYFMLVPFVWRRTGFAAAIVAGYGVGLGSHLLWDVVDYGNVLWLPGGALDRLWLGAHGLLCLTTPGGIRQLFRSGASTTARPEAHRRQSTAR